MYRKNKIRSDLGFKTVEAEVPAATGRNCVHNARAEGTVGNQCAASLLGHRYELLLQRLGIDKTEMDVEELHAAYQGGTKVVTSLSGLTRQWEVEDCHGGRGSGVYADSPELTGSP